MTSAVLAFDFGGSKVAIAVFTAAGNIEEQHRVEIAADDDANAVLARVGAIASVVGDRHHDARVGAVTPGVVLGDRIRLAPNVRGWDRLALADELGAYLGGRAVHVANDVKAAAAAELRWGALAHVDGPGLYVNLGTGVAVAVVVHGRVLTGANGAAGEIGYNEARCDRRQNEALLEHLVGARAIVERARKDGFEMTNASQVLRAIHEPRLVRIVDDTFDELGLHLRAAMHLLDPSHVVIGGGLVGSSDVVLPALTKRLVSRTGPSPKILAAHFGPVASLHGARLVALDPLRWDGQR
jgi:glucokinase